MIRRWMASADRLYIVLAVVTVMLLILLLLLLF